MKQHLSLEHNYKAASNPNEASPVIIMLHGFGSDENDLFSFARELPDHYSIIALKAPISMQPSGNAWYNIYFDSSDGKFSDTEQAIKSRDLIRDCIDEIIDKYNVQKDKLLFLQMKF